MEEKGLYKKILNVMEKVQHLEKDGKIEYGSTKYKYVTEEKVTSTVRQALIEEGLVILPSVVTATQDENLTLAHCVYRIVDVDTGQHEEIQSVGQGSDSQDKGSNKALTGAYKYLLLRTFAIPTGDDPDKTSSSELDDVDKERKRKAIMENLDSELFTGMHFFKNHEEDYDKAKTKTIVEMPTMSPQRLGTRLKLVADMLAVAYQDSVNKELGD